MMQTKKLDVVDNQHSLSLEESISVWIDGETQLSADQLDSPYGRQLWDNYHLIGDVLRSEDLAIEPSELFYARVSKAIDEEPIVFAPNVMTPPTWRRWAMPTVALSAILLTVFWVAQPEPTQAVSPVLASADDLWLDYIDAHHSLTGLAPASYVSYSVGN